MVKKKSWLTPPQQVNHLKSKGVLFSIYDEQKAEKYLRDNNNYFRLRSYRTNFEKRVGGDANGIYIGLDFGMLVDLSIIDMHLRDCLLPITLNIEHFAKMHLLEQIELHREDGYKIVQDFLSEKEIIIDGKKSNTVIAEIRRGLSSPYTKGLINSRPKSDYPAWEFMEVIPFGQFIHFYRFCAFRFEDRHMQSNFYALQSAKGLRNGCAHDNCILNDLKSGSSTHRPQREVTKALGQIGIGRDMRRTKLSNERLQQIATTLYLHTKLSSNGVHILRSKSLHKLSNRMNRNVNYYSASTPVRTSFAFIQMMIKGWFEQ